MKFIHLICLGTLLNACQPSSQTESPQLSITLGQDQVRAKEDKARSELYALHEKYDIERWIFTREIIVKSGGFPHSHPVLTVNTRYIGDETGTLSTYLHEQFHWYLEENKSAVEAAINDLRKTFPDIPKKRPQAARDEYSTYLHLIVCVLEFDALVVLFGEEKARKELKSKNYYTWIYKQVLDNDGAIRDTMKENRIALP